MKIPYITTYDNPYDPANEFREWYAFDTAHDYQTLDLLARLDTGGEHQSPADNAEARLQAIQEMADMNVTGLYVIVYSDP